MVGTNDQHGFMLDLLIEPAHHRVKVGVVGVDVLPEFRAGIVVLEEVPQIVLDPVHADERDHEEVPLSGFKKV